MQGTFSTRNTSNPTLIFTVGALSQVFSLIPAASCPPSRTLQGNKEEPLWSAEQVLPLLPRHHESTAILMKRGSLQSLQHQLTAGGLQFDWDFKAGPQSLQQASQQTETLGSYTSEI